MDLLTLAGVCRGVRGVRVVRDRGVLNAVAKPPKAELRRISIRVREAGAGNLQLVCCEGLTGIAPEAGQGTCGRRGGRVLYADRAALDRVSQIKTVVCRTGDLDLVVDGRERAWKFLRVADFDPAITVVVVDVPGVGVVLCVSLKVGEATSFSEEIVGCARAGGCDFTIS